jgi:diguanylate cyclase (GGDEF)-like protein
MGNKILDSIIEITAHRDLDSLEYSLVATLAELVPVVSISILKAVKENNIPCAEEVVRLDIDDSHADPYTWHVDNTIIKADNHFNECVKNPRITCYDLENGLSRHLFPITDDTQVIGCLVIDSHEGLALHMSLIEGFARIYENYMIVFNESEKDKLTGLYNRRTFDSKLLKLFKSQQNRSEQHNSVTNEPERRHHEHDACTWLIIADIDHFKRVNDSYGHVFGDEVLLTVSQKMKSCFRHSDLLFRIGGEEFLILLEPVSQKVAEKLIDRFRKTIAEHEFSQIGTVTVSAGYAKITEKDYPPAVLEYADRALYYAKEHGRNCSYNYETLVGQGKISPPKQGGAVDLF